MLKSLELTGFKSFAKKTELNFKSKITAIVGPNGSGKSNVAEAFRFVLGEQSIKSMRGKRGEDLIWNGSTEISRANRAGVKITLDNTGNFLSSATGGSALGGDFEEVIIERVVNRDGNNEYYLNGSLVRLKDIFELLSQAHIGASGHHIISQGEADRILSANMKERKEMIEDALGLKIYQYKREESERKLLRTEENIKQVESLRREIAPHIRFLKKQAEKMERAEELRLKLTKFYREYLKREQVYLEKQKELLGSEKKPLAAKLEKLDGEMEEAKQILNASSKKDEKSEKLIEIENQIKKEREEKEKLYREIGRIEGEQKFEENETVPLKKLEELEKEISALSEITKIIDRIRTFILGYKNNNSNKTAELTLANQKLEKQKEKLEELDLKYQFIKSSIEKEKDSSREAEKDIFKISSEQSELRNKMEFLKEKERRLNLEENDWRREVQEGGVLLGTAILGFEKDELSGGTEDTTSPPTPLLAKERGEEERNGQLDRRRELEKMKIRLEELGGAGGAEVTKEYREALERDEYLQKELDDLKKSAESLRQLINELLEKLDIEFKQGIEKINDKFQELFSLMFGGGNAELKIENWKPRREVGEPTETSALKIDLDESETGQTENESGVEISVSLPRKHIRNLDMLSGGERALTSIALLFAVSQVNPPPFIVLDETDAALDEANSKKYGDMIESLSKVSQLILITHNRETMSRAGVIYGITMGKDGISRLLSIAFDEAVAVAK